MKRSVSIFRLKQQAKALARERAIPHHQALDRVARDLGFRSWSHLSVSSSDGSSAHGIFKLLRPGDMTLLGARPGHGKTSLGLGIAIEAARHGRNGFFFTLEDNEDAIHRRMHALEIDPGSLRDLLILDTSDEICADYVVHRMAAGPLPAVAVIDYMQLLDRRRTHPELVRQLQTLKAFATETKSVIVLLSQIDRSFEGQSRSLPTLTDVRRSNPFDVTLFTRTCFLHDGRVRLEAVTPKDIATRPR